MKRKDQRTMYGVGFSEKKATAVSKKPNIPITPKNAVTKECGWNQELKVAACDRTSLIPTIRPVTRSRGAVGVLPENSATRVVRIRLRMPAGRAPRCVGDGSQKSR